MSRRMIDTSLWQNEKFTRMPLGARMLQIGIITHADDQGRAKANPSFLRMQIFPDDEDITNADIQKWFGLMIKNGTIISYTVDEKQYVQLCNWWKYQSLQYAAPSQFPRPDGWKDRIRKTVTKGFIATCNWQTVDGTQLEDTCDQDGNPLPRQPMPKGPPTPPPSGQSPNGLKPHQVVDNAKDNGHSPESSGGHSPESSPERTIELNRIELNRTELNRKEESTRETKSGPVEEPPPPLSDPYMDAAMHRFQRRQETGGRAKRRGAWPEIDKKCAPELRLPLVEKLIDIHGLRALIDEVEDDVKLTDMHQMAADLYAMGYATTEGIETIYAGWRVDWKNKTPSGRQFVQYASTQKSKPPVAAQAMTANGNTIISNNGNGMIAQGDITKMYQRK